MREASFDASPAGASRLRYEMSHERVLRASLRDLRALQEGRPESGRCRIRPGATELTSFAPRGRPPMRRPKPRPTADAPTEAKAEAVAPTEAKAEAVAPTEAKPEAVAPTEANRPRPTRRPKPRRRRGRSLRRPKPRGARIPRGREPYAGRSAPRSTRRGSPRRPGGRDIARRDGRIGRGHRDKLVGADGLDREVWPSGPTSRASSASSCARSRRTWRSVAATSPLPGSSRTTSPSSITVAVATLMASTSPVAV